MSVLSKRYFHSEAAAFKFVEGIIWAGGDPVCPHCGCTGRTYDLGKTRIGLKKCGDCRKQFTVRVGTIFEDSHLPLHKWLQAIYLLCSSKKGISSKQIERTLEVTYKTAWFLTHRIREAMRSGDLAPFGQGGGGVEADETFIGREPGVKVVTRGIAEKMKVLSLIDRSTGKARSMILEDMKGTTIAAVVDENISREARLITDDARHYVGIGWNFADHGRVNHTRGEYVSRQDATIHTNTVEGFFSIFKRGMRGVYQHCSKKHLHRYLAEFDFRYSNRSALGCEDQERAERALKGIIGKRLTYRRPDLGATGQAAR
jgi:transposase-like protein